MISYNYDKKDWPCFQTGRQLEWSLTNGIGGYAGSSLIGAHSRTHQGYLIASLHAPTSRYLAFSKINETLQLTTASGVTESYSLETSQHQKEGKTIFQNGQQYLADFSYDGSVHYHYDVNGISLHKHITLKQGENVCAVAYEIEGALQDATLYLTPLFNFREHSTLSKKSDLSFDMHILGQALTLIPDANPDINICFQISEGTFEKNPLPFDENMQLQIEVDLETEGLDCHYCPVQIPIFIPAGSHKKISILCSVVPSGTILSAVTEESAFSLLKERESYTNTLLHTAGYQDSFAKGLSLAADHFLCHRASTGLKTILAGLPWFTDWGRDTMIAFTGVTLATHRFEDAKEILLTFAKYIKNGIVPNMFPDNNTPPLYNTADASLWYFYAVWKYLEYVDTPEAYDFIEKEIYPHLKEIIHAYKNGTDFCIHMDEDGLMHAGSGLDQITWMDVRVGEWVVTPRHGKPVEINALWYNALKIMEQLALRFHDTSLAAEYESLAAHTKTSFCSRFWNEKQGCLYDVIGDDQTLDDSLRPNQIYAVSLPFTMLSSPQEKSIVEVVKRELYVGCGLRSLSTTHPDYHGIYCGSLPKRDAAYHQGTAWGFLLGGFITAYTKVYEHSPACILQAKELLTPVMEHFTNSGCIGSISEIFDGNEPHQPRGCYAQAWSVGEVLRSYAEDILPYLP